MRSGGACRKSFRSAISKCGCCRWISLMTSSRPAARCRGSRCNEIVRSVTMTQSRDLDLDRGRQGANPRRLRPKSGVAIRIDVSIGWVSPPDDVAMMSVPRRAGCVFAISSWHSRDCEANDAFDRLGNAMTMRITDDGVGFNPLVERVTGPASSSARPRPDGQCLEPRSSGRWHPVEAVVPTGVPS